jgi:hypothetical protein
MLCIVAMPLISLTWCGGESLIWVEQALQASVWLMWPKTSGWPFPAESVTSTLPPETRFPRMSSPPLPAERSTSDP